jgi:hypothetical protein
VRDLVTAPVEDDAGNGEVWERATRATVAQLRAVLGGERVALPPVAFQSLSPRIEKQRLADVAKIHLRKRGRNDSPAGSRACVTRLTCWSPRWERSLSVPCLGKTDGPSSGRSVPSLRPSVSRTRPGADAGATGRLLRDAASVITVRTQKRILSQVTHFLDWAVYEGQLTVNPFASVRIDQKVKQSHYAVLTDTEVRCLLADRDHTLYPVLLFCLLTEMRAGEAVGLLREDLVDWGNLGTFALVRPNSLRSHKTTAAERVVPLHSELSPLIPDGGPLFPALRAAPR